jgi:DNA-binding MarR family transcriptional regulator
VNARAARSVTRAGALATPAGHARFLPYLLNRVTSRLNTGFQAELHRRGMTLTHWRVLAFLAEHDGLPVSALADMTATDPSTLSRALMRLDSQGCVSRRPGASDNRVVQVTLTAEGRRVFREIAPIAQRLHEAAIRGLAPEELDALGATLSKILANLT